MYRSVRTGGKWFGTKVAEFGEFTDDEITDIQTFAESGEPVLLTLDKEQAEELIDEDIEEV